MNRLYVYIVGLLVLLAASMVVSAHSVDRLISQTEESTPPVEQTPEITPPVEKTPETTPPVTPESTPPVTPETTPPVTPESTPPTPVTPETTPPTPVPQPTPVPPPAVQALVSVPEATAEPTPQQRPIVPPRTNSLCAPGTVCYCIRSALDISGTALLISGWGILRRRRRSVSIAPPGHDG